MTIASEWLVEIGANTGSAPIVLRYSLGGFVSKPTDNPPNVHYAPRLKDVGRFARHLFSPGRTMGEGQFDLGELSFANTDGQLDQVLTYAVDGGDVVLKRIGSKRLPLASSVAVLRAMAEQFDGGAGSEVIRLRFYDRRRVIDKPIQTNRYGGTTTAGGQGTADGTAEMKDTLKPLVFGFARQVVPVIANPFELVLQVNDGPVEAVQLYDGGVPLLYDGDSATLAALLAANITPGHYRTCKALGYVRPGGAIRGRAAYAWTADVTEGAAGQRNAGASVLRMLTKLGIGDPANLDLSSFATLSLQAPQEVGIWLDSETSGLSAIRQVLDSIGGWMVPDNAGRYAVGRLAAPGTPIAKIRDRDIIGEAFGFTSNPDTDGGIPAHKLTLKWGKNYRVFGETDIGGCVTDGDPDRAAGLRQEYREVLVEDQAVKDLHPLAPELEIETLLRHKADAEAEAARRFALYKVNRIACGVTVPRELAEAISLNATITLDVGLLISARPMLVIGQENDHGAETSTLALWG